MEGANGSNLLNHLPDELLERVVAALIPAPSPFTLASDVWAGALGLALSCRRMYSITTAEAHRKLRPPGTAKPRGVLVTKVRACLWLSVPAVVAACPEGRQPGAVAAASSVSQPCNHCHATPSR